MSHMTNAARQSALADVAIRIRNEAAQAEANGHLSDAVVEGMKAAGIFRMFVHREYGGLELDLPEIVETISTVAKIDASAGWVAMIGSSSALALTMLPRHMFEQIYQGNPDAILASSVQLRGAVEQRGGAWHVSGQWPFASGCLHADWLAGFCAVAPSAPDAPPQIGIAILPASRWKIVDTWHVPGLKATASDDIALDSPVVLDESFFFFGQEPWAKGPLYDAGLFPSAALLHGAVSLGIAEGALDDLLEIARAGRKQDQAAALLRETESFHVELGQVQADIRAARSTLTGQTARQWERALAGRVGSADVLIEAEQAAIWTVRTCVGAVDRCFAMGGSAALYETSTLQRRMRDIHVAAQHSKMQPRHYDSAGKWLLDQKTAA